jgi:hypothetical protein
MISTFQYVSKNAKIKSAEIQFYFQSCRNLKFGVWPTKKVEIEGIWEFSAEESICTWKK